MAKPTVATWKHRITKEAAREYKVKPDTVRIVPRDTKRPIYATWQLLQPILCPVNNKFYRVYWVRTNEQFMNGIRR